ncbi:MAG TPA: DUF3592 domain-containing protein [Verrucomicrobiae bacterium]|nr:DUF3592 domain-containing protein [Verrucomicrobiae bacterium]
MQAPDETVIPILVDVGLISQQEVDAAKREAQAKGCGIVEALIHSGRLTEMDVSKAMASQYGLDTVDLPNYESSRPNREISPEVIAAIPREVAVREKVIPLFKHGSTLTVAIGDPLDLDVAQRLGQTLKMTIQPVVSCPTHIAAAVSRYYGGTSAEPERAAVASRSQQETPPATGVSPGPREEKRRPLVKFRRVRNYMPVFGFFIIIGLGTTQQTVRFAWRVQQAEHWMQLPCKVVSSNMREYTSRSVPHYEPQIVYQYEFGGREYTSSQYDLLYVHSSEDVDVVRRIVDRYAPGTTAICYVNPNKPGDAVLSREDSVGWLDWAIPIWFLVIGVVGVFAVRRERRRNPGSSAPIVSTGSNSR